ncbi:hypothetical protein [Archangium lipolyticum]|uniref:hypothetical protein n=1 Tax=Archangium lipolyticum TaxID=2970465 RepID=UPI00214A2E20|nr:hypothetical protein [Archangium lipolyticum]
MRVWNHLGAWALAVVLCACGPGLSNGNGGTPGLDGGGSGTDAGGDVPQGNPRPLMDSAELSYDDPEGHTVTISVTGRDFVPTTVIRLGSSALPTTYVSETRLTASLTHTQLAEWSNRGVDVFTPSPGGGDSGSVGLSIPAPVLSELVPGSIPSGCQDELTPVRILGKNFYRASTVIYLGGIPLPTTFVSNQELLVQVERSRCQQGGFQSLSVKNDLGPWPQLSGFVQLPVRYPEPRLDDVWPRVVSANDTTFTHPVSFTLQGSGFRDGSQVYWNGNRVESSRTNEGVLTALLPPELFTTAGRGAFTVHNPEPGGGTSGSFEILVQSGPVLRELSPGRAVQGSAGLVLEVFGDGFGTSSSTLLWNGSARTTWFHGNGQLVADITAEDLSTAGTARISVLREDGKESQSLGFVVSASAPTPVVSSLSPGVVSAGSGARVITVYGSGFQPRSQVRWNGEERATSFQAETPDRLGVSLTAADLQTPGEARVTVSNPAPGGGTSLPLMFQIDSRHEVPLLTWAEPGWLPAGSGDVELTLGGYGFEPASIVRWNGVALKSTFQRETPPFSSLEQTVLRATVPAGLLATSGAGELTVSNPEPGGGTSEPYRLPVVASNAWRASRLHPSVLDAGAQPVSLYIESGSEGPFFSKESVVRVGFREKVPLTQSATGLTVQLDAEDLVTAGNLEVRVFTPYGGWSAPLFLRVMPPRQPLLQSISPGVLSVGEWAPLESRSLVLWGVLGARSYMSGSSPVSGLVARWKGAERSVSLFNDSIRAMFPVTGADLETAGTVPVGLARPAAGGGGSLPALLHVTLERPVPFTLSLSPAGLPVGSASFPLRVRGSGFHAASVVRWNGEPLPTRWEEGMLVATVPASALATAGEATVVVHTPGPGGGTSLPLLFRVLP